MLENIGRRDMWTFGTVGRKFWLAGQPGPKLGTLVALGRVGLDAEGGFLFVARHGEYAGEMRDPCWLGFICTRTQI